MIGGLADGERDVSVKVEQTELLSERKKKKTIVKWSSFTVVFFFRCRTDHRKFVYNKLISLCLGWEGEGITRAVEKKNKKINNENKKRRETESTNIFFVPVRGRQVPKNAFKFQHITTMAQMRVAVLIFFCPKYRVIRRTG